MKRIGLRFLVGIVTFSIIIGAIIVVKKVAADVLSIWADSPSEGDSYGAYYDDSENKALTRVVSNGANQVTVYYTRTENLRNVSVSSRDDSYGTYDVYVDREDNTEYLFLYNSNLLCGMRKENAGSLNRDNAISESEAISIATAWVRARQSNGNEYVFDNCFYEECGGYYDIQFFLPIMGYKSDEIVRLWVDLQGNVNAYSDFNHGRYNMIALTPEKYANAQSILSDRIAGMFTSCTREIRNTYVSKNDQGEVVLVMEVYFTKSVDNGNGEIVGEFVWGEKYEQPIE